MTIETSEILRVSDLRTYFPVRSQGIIPHKIGDVKAVDGIEPHARGWRDSRAGGRERVGQDDGRPVDPDARPSHKRADRDRRPGDHWPLVEGVGARSAQGADDLPGSLQRPEPSPHRGRDHQRAVQHPGGEAARRGQGRRPGADGAGRPEPGALQPVSERVLRRPAPADRDRQGDRAASEADRVRRARLGARRLDPGPDSQPAAGSPAGVRDRLPVRRPRPGGRPPDLAPRRGHVPRPHRRDGAAAR